MPRVPERTCIGCRRRAPATALVRLVVHDGRITADRERRLPGRGASLHPVAACIEAASRQGALTRALRTSVATLPADALAEMTRQGAGRKTP